ncbi:hypothetical protein LMG26858_02312 [Achromobacter anxifer]|uniref:Uncharacterized protein n=1 Tax=Achromobacter anxifer TaxID=1287737 RepID=A0A6S7CSX1_9BURK|nr:hypothetical protein [Achromobacter anxifer]CAB3862839.1 hypothetical protein LMG26858_02312 [Achromobacter anxifer]
MSAEQIFRAREHARRGHSFTFTAQLLGVSNRKLRRLIDAAHADDIQFVQGSQSLARKALHESLRGCVRIYSEESQAAIMRGLAHGRQINRERHGKRYTAFGVTGFLRDLKVLFNCKFNIKTLRDRLHRGMSIEEALTTESQASKRGVRPPQFEKNIAVQARRAAARIAEVIERRLTPTMLQYRAPEHSIVVTDRKGAWITVEVGKGAVTLHRLRFVSSFESGVFFAFNPDERRHLNFIAFEPTNPALIDTHQVPRK